MKKTIGVLALATLLMIMLGCSAKIDIQQKSNQKEMDYSGIKADEAGYAYIETTLTNDMTCRSQVPLSDLIRNWKKSKKSIVITHTTPELLPCNKGPKTIGMHIFYNAIL